MRLNREKIAFILAVVLFVAGLYGVAVAFVSPSQVVRVPNVDLPRTELKVFSPQPRTFESKDPPRRNPFTFAEGWQPLDTLPLPRPPLPDHFRVLPLLSASLPAEAGGLLFEGSIPSEKKDEAVGDSAGESGAGQGGGS